MPPNIPFFSVVDHQHRLLTRITYRMSDQMGVVYYGNYFELFEMGRTELLRTTGVAYRQMEEQGLFFPVVKAEANYHGPARYDDVVEVRTTVTELTRVKVAFRYEVRREGEDELLCSGMTLHVVTDADARPRRLPPEWMAKLEEMSGK